MTLRIGIVGEEPELLYALYQQVIEATPIHQRDDHLDALIYARRLHEDFLSEVTHSLKEQNYFLNIPADTPSINHLANILEASHHMHQAKVDVMFCPEMDLTALGDISGENRAPNQISLVIFPDLKPITPELLNGMREHLSHNTVPDDEQQWEQFDELHRRINAYAKAIVAIGREETVENTIIIPPHHMIDESSLVSLTHHPKYDNPANLAIHGGHGVESGNLAFLHATTTYDVAVSLFSQPRTHDMLPAINELIHHGYLSENIHLAALDDLREGRQCIDALHNDVEIMACNTAHSMFDAINAGMSTPAINIIEAAVERIPQNAAVLLLATRQTIQAELYPKAAQKLNREDIEWIIPTEQEQWKLQAAIFENLTLKHIAEGAFMVQEVVDGYVEKITSSTKHPIPPHDNDTPSEKEFGCKELVLLGGCSEAIMALRGQYPEDIIIDASSFAIDKAVAFSIEKQKAHHQKDMPTTPDTVVEQVDYKSHNIAMPLSTSQRY